jgi:nicotinamidase-related amidase
VHIQSLNSPKSTMTKTVLLLLDLQDGILDQCDSNNTPYFTKVLNVTAAARFADIPVIYVRTCFRPSYPKISSHSSSFARIVPTNKYIEGDASVAFPSAIAPQPSDIIVTKRRVSAFVGSDLEVVLKGLGADSLVVAGLATSGAVLSTVRQAADMDYQLTVLKDLCVDNKPEVHTVLLEQVFPRQGRVVETGEWIDEVGGGR